MTWHAELAGIGHGQTTPRRLQLRLDVDHADALMSRLQTHARAWQEDDDLEVVWIASCWPAWLPIPQGLQRKDPQA